MNQGITRAMMPLRRRLALALAPLLVASGCRIVGPNPAPPSAPTPAAYQEAPPAGWQGAQPSDGAAKGAWWMVFADPQLDGLERQVDGNFSLRSAQAQYLQARALIRFYRADALPSITTGPAITPQRNSANRPLGGGVAATYTDLLLPFDVTWEPDLWGRVHREVEEQTAATAASAADVANLRLSLQAELALDYFQARGLDADAQLLAREVDDYTKALRLTQTRHSGGIVSNVDVAEADTQLQSTRAQLQDIQVQRSQFEHALAVLMGQPPEGFHLAAAPLSGTPPAIPTGVPAELLQRRPDIAAAERQAAAANAAIGVALSAFYPTVSLSAGVGLESTSLGNLFTLPSTLWGLGAAASETVLSGGRRHAVTESAQRAYDAGIDNYRQTVLQAFQEVEDNLGALRLLAAESETQQAAVTAAQRSLALSNTRYSGGVTTYLEVLTAQSADLADERAALDLLSRRMLASVRLIKALGGGWDVSRLPSPSAQP